MYLTITTTCMQKYLLQAFIVILFSSITSLSAQDLYIPRDMKKAYKKRRGQWMEKPGKGTGRIQLQYNDYVLPPIVRSGGRNDHVFQQQHGYIDGLHNKGFLNV
jgi:hypothetical protein